MGPLFGSSLHCSSILIILILTRYSDPQPVCMSARGVRGDPDLRSGPAVSRVSAEAPLVPLSSSASQPISKIEAEAEREVLIEKRKAAAGDSLHRPFVERSSPQALRRFAVANGGSGTFGPVAGSYAATASKREALNERLMMVMKTEEAIVEAPPRPLAPTVFPENRLAGCDPAEALPLRCREAQVYPAAPVSCASSALPAKPKTKLLPGGGKKTRTSERDGTINTAPTASPDGSPSIVQRMKKMGSILPTHRRRRSPSDESSARTPAAAERT